jgi:hypothetical protein
MRTIQTSVDDDAAAPGEQLPRQGRWLQRLADEFEDDGVDLPTDPEFRMLLLEELDHCRRAPVFEGRPPTFGAIIMPREGPQAERGSVDVLDFDLVPLGVDPAAGRAYADGRSSYLMRSVDGSVALACFAGSMLMEADLVRLQRATGAAIIQRTPVLDVVRVAVDETMITWDGRHWRSRPMSTALADVLVEHVPDLDPSFAQLVLELAVHWLAPARIGATIVFHDDDDDIDWSSLDTSTAAHTPPLSICDRRHFSAIAAVLRQHDLSVVVDRDGSLRKVAVGLRWTQEAENAVNSDRGMRHRSAKRYSHDHPTATLVVVSEDGPVTVFRNGTVAVSTGDAATV